VAVVERALEHDLSQRLPDCTAFADALVTALPDAFPQATRKRALERISSGVSAAPSSPRSRAERLLPDPAMTSGTMRAIEKIEGRRSNLRLVVGGAMVIATLIVLFAAWSRRGPDPQTTAIASTPSLPPEPPTPTPIPIPTPTPTPNPTPPPTATPAPTPTPTAVSTAAVATTTAAKTVKPPVTATAEPSQFGAAGVSSSY
jgi:hypothetical protein